MAILPPLDLVTARNNPKFEALYRGLTTSILNSDGSVKVSSQDARQQESVGEVKATYILQTTIGYSDLGCYPVGAFGSTACLREDYHSQSCIDTPLPS